MTSEVRTAEEGKAARIVAMGDELGTLYDALWQQLVWLQTKWSEYVALYGTKESRVETINQTAPLFARIFQDALFDDVLMHIARMTDPPKSAGRANLTVQRLSALAPPQVGTQVEASLAEVLRASEFCRDWRNRRIAHRDLELAVGNGATPLKAASRAKVDAAIARLADTLNVLELHYFQSTTFFDNPNQTRGVMALLRTLDDGILVERERMKKRASGSYDPELYKHREL